MTNFSVNMTMDKRQQFMMVNILDEKGNSVIEFGTPISSLGPKIHQKLLLQDATSFVKSQEIPKEVPTSDLKELEVPKEEPKEIPKVESEVPKEVPTSDLKELEVPKEEIKVPEVPKEVPSSDLNGLKI